MEGEIKEKQEEMQTGEDFKESKQRVRQYKQRQKKKLNARKISKKAQKKWYQKTEKQVKRITNKGHLFKHKNVQYIFVKLNIRQRPLFILIRFDLIYSSKRERNKAMLGINVKNLIWIASKAKIRSRGVSFDGRKKLPSKQRLVY